MPPSSKRRYINHPDNLCSICGEYTPPTHRAKLSSRIKLAHAHYFGYKVGDEAKEWAPHIYCNRCRTSLLFWFDRKRKQMPFGVPMIWREQRDHVSDYYFCMTKITGFSRKSKSKIIYPTCKSALGPVPHCSDIPVPSPPCGDVEPVSSDEPSCSDESEDTEIDPSFKDESKPLFINQERPNDLVRDLYLSKEKAEILGSRLQQWNLLQEGTTISSFRQRNKSLSSFYATANDICYCTNVDGSMNDLGYEHNLADWRLFIDSSKTSLKAVLLHNGNSKPSIPVGHSTSRKETYNTMKVLLEQLNYPKYTWKICSDLKVVSFLLGLQSGYIKHMCFLCRGGHFRKSVRKSANPQIADSSFYLRICEPNFLPQIFADLR